MSMLTVTDHTLIGLNGSVEMCSCGDQSASHLEHRAVAFANLGARTPVLSSDLAFTDFLRRVQPREEVVVWSESHLIAHLYDEETERLLPVARGDGGSGRLVRKRKPPKYRFTRRQMEIAIASLERKKAG